jgi:ATP-dependent Clp protease ATP-binding subunit ClpC
MDVSQQIHRIYTEARDISRRSNKPFGSAALLLAMFTEEAAPNQARTVLQEYELDEDRILATLAELPAEPDDTMRVIQQKTQMTALSCDAELVNSLHLLLAICQVSSSVAYRLLERLGVNIGQLRVKVFSYVTGVLPRRFYTSVQVADPEPTPAAGGVDWGRLLEVASLTRARAAALPPETGYEDDDAEDLDESGGEGEDDAPHGRRRRSVLLTGADREAAAARALAALVAGARRQPGGAAAAVVTPAAGGAIRGRPVSATVAAARALVGGAPGNPGAPQRSPFALDPDEFPLLAALGRNLTVEAEAGRLDPLVGREDELEAVLDILHKRRSNNPCLIGEPGVGKTALVEGVAQRLVARTSEGGEARAVVEVNVSSLVAGTQLRGAFSERMAQLRAEVRSAGRRVIVFIDEIHTLLGAGAGSGPLDAANDLKAALARGEFPCIGATTTREYRQHIEGDPALERRFQPILLEEPSRDEARRILDAVKDRYEAHHGVRYAPDVTELAVRLSARYIPDRRLPDKALNLLDLAGARVARTGRKAVEGTDVAQVVAKLSGVPAERLILSDAKRLLQMDEFLAARVIGQPDPLRRITAMIQRNSAGFRSHRPIGSFLLLGPTGVGKTETVRVLAEFLFEDRNAVTRFDMSEYLEPHSISKLIGAAPGYVGHEDGGQLTEAVHRRPYQIVLFDEVEKASREVLQILLQVLEEGTLRDGKGRRVDFANTVIALTTNLGADELEKKRSGLGFGRATGGCDPEATARRAAQDAAEAERLVIEAGRRAFPPELWNRIEEKLVYRPLDRAAVAAIAGLLLRESADRLRAESGIAYEADPAVIDFLVAQGGFDVRYGARPMRRTIQRFVEGAVSRVILERRAHRGDVVKLTVEEDRLTTEVVRSA